MLNDTGGTVAATGSVTVQGGGILNMTGSLFASGPLTNAGTMNLTNSIVYLYNDNGVSDYGGIVNQGQINFHGSGGDEIYGVSGYEYLINQGTISQRPGSGGSSISVPIFSNPGTLDSQEGTLTLKVVNLPPSSILNFGLNSPTDYGVISIQTATVLTGTVSANFNSGFVPAAGQSFKVLTFPSFSGIFANTNVPAGAVAQGVYGSTAFSLLFASSGISTGPLLTIEQVSANTIDVSWAVAAGNFNLQTSPDMKAGSWSDVLSGITTVGSNYVLTRSRGGKAAFYRLESP
jgi:hypothetical protein